MCAKYTSNMQYDEMYLCNGRVDIFTIFIVYNNNKY